MADESNIAGPNEITLETTKADRAVSFLRAVAGAAPVVGSLIGEVLTVTIPNQKQDRIVAFLKVLDDKVRYIEEDVLRQKVVSEEFTDLLEDALRQVSRSLSDERRQYIASLLKNSLSSNELEQAVHKRLLALLNDLNDAEVILLKYEALPNEEREEFREKHAIVLQTELRYYYLQRLIAVGLLERDIDIRDNNVSYPATTLAKILLRYIE